MKQLFNTKVKLTVGIAAMAIAVIIGLVTGFSYDSNGAMSIIFAIGLISLMNIFVSKIYKTDISYSVYMLGNIVGLVVSLYVISITESIGNIYTALFLAVICVALWVMEMWLLNVEGTLKRVIGAFIVNLFVYIAAVVAVVAVVTVSVVVALL